MAQKAPKQKTLLKSNQNMQVPGYTGTCILKNLPKI
jgi:hypothetical protein